MSLTLAHEIWNEFRRYLGPNDKQEAADTLIAILIDTEGYEAQDIRAEFSNDSFIKEAVEPYLEIEPVDFEEDYDDEEDDEFDDEEDEY